MDTVTKLDKKNVVFCLEGLFALTTQTLWRKCTVCRHVIIPVSWFHKAALSAPRKPFSQPATCSTGPAAVSETRRECAINWMACKLYLNETTKHRNTQKHQKASQKGTCMIKTSLNTQFLRDMCDIMIKPQLTQENVTYYGQRQVWAANRETGHWTKLRSSTLP